MVRLALIFILAGALGVSAELAPVHTVYNWSNYTGTIYRTPRTNIVDVTTFGADKTGVTNNAATNIMAAWTAAPTNSEIFVPNGTYRMGGLLTFGAFPWEGGKTLRGESTNVIFLCLTNSGYMMKVGGNGNYPLYGQLFPTNPIVQGATNFIVPTLDGDNFPGGPITVGSVVSVLSRNPTNLNGGGLQVIDYGNDWSMVQQAIVHSISGNTISIGAPLAFQPFSNTVVLDWYGTPTRDIGIENITLTFTNDGTGEAAADGFHNFGIQAQVLHNSWFSNVTVITRASRGLAANLVVHSALEGLHLVGPGGGGNQAAGFLVSDISNSRFENNLIRGFFPRIEYNRGTVANVFGYNYAPSPVANGVAFQMHGPQPCFNLWEGNVGPTHHVDGLFGGAAHETFFRNDYDGEEALFEGGVAHGSLFFNRWVASNNVIANILGTNATNFTYTYEPGGTVGGIFRHGYPELLRTAHGSSWMASGGTSNSPPIPWNFPGHEHQFWTTNCQNGRYVFTNDQLNTNILWGDFAAYVPASALTRVILSTAANTNVYVYSWGGAPRSSGDGGGGAYATAVTSSNMTLSRAVSAYSGDRVWVLTQSSEPGVGAYQQRQMSNQPTHRIVWNLVYTNGVGQAGTLVDTTGDTLPASLYLNAKPAWFGTNRWPAKDVEASPDRTPIPAETRYAGGSVEGGEGAGDVLPVILGGPFTIQGASRVQ